MHPLYNPQDSFFAALYVLTQTMLEKVKKVCLFLIED